MDLDKDRITSFFIFVIILIVFIGSSIFLYNSIMLGTISSFTLFIGIVWLFTIVCTTAALFYDFFGVFEAVLGFIPFMDLPFMLANLSENNLAIAYTIEKETLTVQFKNSKTLKYKFIDISVVRTGRQYGSKSIFRIKYAGKWKSFIFSSDVAIAASKKLQKAVGQFKSSNEFNIIEKEAIKARKEKWRTNQQCKPQQKY